MSGDVEEACCYRVSLHAPEMISYPLSTHICKFFLLQPDNVQRYFRTNSLSGTFISTTLPVDRAHFHPFRIGHYLHRILQIFRMYRVSADRMLSCRRIVAMLLRCYCVVLPPFVTTYLDECV